MRLSCARLCCYCGSPRPVNSSVGLARVRTGSGSDRINGSTLNQPSVRSVARFAGSGFLSVAAKGTLDLKPFRLMETGMSQSDPDKDDTTHSKESGRLDFLCKGTHPVEVVLQPEKTVGQFRQALERGYVHIKFTDTKGGTELGLRLDLDASGLSQADFEGASGMAKIVGNLTFEYTKVRCIAEIDLSTLEGTGHLEKLESLS